MVPYLLPWVETRTPGFYGVLFWGNRAAATRAFSVDTCEIVLVVELLQEGKAANCGICSRKQ